MKSISTVSSRLIFLRFVLRLVPSNLPNSFIMWMFRAALFSKYLIGTIGR